MREKLIEELVKEVSTALNGRVLVMRDVIRRNNGSFYNVVGIAYPNSNIVKHIRIDNLLDGLESGALRMDEAVKRVVMEYEDFHLKCFVDGMQFDLDREFILSNINYRVVSYERNKDILGSVPYKRYLNLLVLFYCNLPEESDEAVQSFMVNNMMMESYNISMDELDAAAAKVTLERSDFLFVPLIDTIDWLIRGGSREELRQKSDIRHVESRPNSFVLTNKTGINGGNAILYPSVFKELADSMDSNLYVLPSSIHELMVMPINEAWQGESALLQMVCDINATQVPPEEFLEDSVYIYDRETNEISLCDIAVK